MRMHHAPVSSRMRSSWFMVDVPGNSGLPPSSSPRMHPAAHRHARATLSRSAVMASCNGAATQLSPCRVRRQSGRRDHDIRMCWRERTCRPGVYAICVLCGAQQDLWRAVPAHASHIVSYVHGVLHCTLVKLQLHRRPGCKFLDPTCSARCNLVRQARIINPRCSLAVGPIMS